MTSRPDIVLIMGNDGRAMLMKSSAHSLYLCLAMLSASFSLYATETASRSPPLSSGGRSLFRSIYQPVPRSLQQRKPSLPLGEFRAIDSARDTPTLTRAASKINENLYASTALERGTLKIKSMQITAADSGPRAESGESESAGVHERYSARLYPTFTKAQSQQKLQNYLPRGKTNAITPIRKVPFAMSSQITAKRG